MERIPQRGRPTRQVHGIVRSNRAITRVAAMRFGRVIPYGLRNLGPYVALLL